MDKILIVDHPYHKKTQSSSFIVELLSQNYDVELIFDDSWQEGSDLDLSFIDDQYKAVVFWQNIYPEMLASIKCKNIIFFPMYDAIMVGVSNEFWYSISNVKIISFCKTLYEQVSSMGFQAIHIKYYPEPLSYPSSGDRSVFFWQRRGNLDWSKVKCLLSKSNVDSVHIHRAVDPEHKYVAPSMQDEEKYRITYSDWFATKEDYLHVVKQKSIYIAPRVHEGIGFSFLEAMAMGKAVVAANHPTMNEYITHGVNGYLFTVDDLQPIDFSNLEQVQECAFNTIVEGRKQWNEGNSQIFEFIEEVARPNIYFDNKKRYVKILKVKSMIKKMIKYALPYGIVRLYQKCKNS
ncbi:glycosyltransferase family 4 protein [Sporomusa sphaeroides DSM 2875]|uniref:glycosyltransferase family 4 protein n=1 Tax=Sporomusa sphaeroides TaxID=47679 RepID=UPI00202DFBCB|nr:glycosyltransferase family 4 protein [Sporomusa sphaeroides]MCM0758035.1 glycosyltransferase family 4 protein [Sporomusa sphaeroides DSM 2875]